MKLTRPSSTVLDMTTFAIPRPSAFRLSAAASFFAGFTPGSGMAAADSGPDRLTLAFRLDRTFDAVAVSLREEGDVLVARFAGCDDSAAVTKQVARILGLEGDAETWADVGRRDPVVGRLQREFPGFFTAAKPSPYDAAVWSVIAPRMNMKQAASVKIAIARERGDAVTLDGQTHHVFPAPAVLARLGATRGLTDEKVVRLRGIGQAALEGKLEVDRLRGQREADALRDLQALRGVGPWAASHIYYRGAAPVDALPTAEPRVLHGLADAYGLAAPDETTFRRIAEGWRPHRMWVCVLLSRHLARVGGWRAPGLARERELAGKRLARAVGA
jgi:DNA-3-methyladenine glycosylase II